MGYGVKLSVAASTTPRVDGPAGAARADDADRRVSDRSGGDDLIRLRHGDRRQPQFPLIQRLCMRPLIASVLVPNDRSARNSER